MVSIVEGLQGFGILLVLASCRSPEQALHIAIVRTAEGERRELPEVVAVCAACLFHLRFEITRVLAFPMSRYATTTAS